MDLYRILRLSLYALVASGAFSVWLVGRNPYYLALVVGAACLAHFTVDAGRWRPLRTGLAAALCLALLCNYLLPAAKLLGAQNPREAAAQMAYYLIAVQVVLFFSVFRGSAVFTFCGSTLFVVVVSGILDASPSLLLRLFLFLLATTWTLLVHSLWRERARFLDQELRVEAATHKGARPPSRESARTSIPERTVWQGLQLSSSVALACLLCGFLLFFAWPRLSSDLIGYANALFFPAGPASGSQAPGRQAVGTMPGGRSWSNSTGYGEQVSLDSLGHIERDPSPALAIHFDKPLFEIANRQSQILIRARIYTEYRDREWHKPLRRPDLDAAAGSSFVSFAGDHPNFLAPPAATGAPYRVRQRIELLAAAGSVYFALAPVRQLGVKRLGVDEEGGLFPADQRTLERDTEEARYEALSELPADLERLPPEARFGTRQEKYLRWQGSFADASSRARLERLAQELLRGTASDRDRILRLRGFLRESGRFTYSLHPAFEGREPILEFLTAPDPARRRGHCAVFATAFVLLCRAAGIPARLVDGFSYALTPAAALAMRGRPWQAVTLKNQDAHAWAEVSFREYGWVPVGPTPPSGTGDSQGLPSPEPPESPLAAGPSPSPEQHPEDPFAGQGDQGLVSRCWNYFLNFDSSAQEELYGSLSDRASRLLGAAGDLLTGLTGQGGLTTLVVWTVLAALAGVVSLSLWRVQGRRRDPYRLPLRAKAAVHFYNDLLAVLSRRGFTRRAGQTPREFAQTVVQRGGQVFHPVFELTAIFERVRYGGEDISEGEFLRVKRAFEYLEVELKHLPAAPGPGNRA